MRERERGMNKPERFTIFVKTENNKFSWDLFIVSINWRGSFGAFLTVISIQVQQLMHYILSDRYLENVSVRHHRETAVQNNNNTCSPFCHVASLLLVISTQKEMSLDLIWLNHKLHKQLGSSLCHQNPIAFLQEILPKLKKNPHEKDTYHGNAHIVTTEKSSSLTENILCYISR